MSCLVETQKTERGSCWWRITLDKLPLPHQSMREQGREQHLLRFNDPDPLAVHREAQSLFEVKHQHCSRTEGSDQEVTKTSI